jgi:hypothetical protein
MNVRQARIRESLGLLEKTRLNIAFQTEYSSLSLSLLFNCKCVCRLSTPSLKDNRKHPRPGTTHSPHHSSIYWLGITRLFPSHRLTEVLKSTWKRKRHSLSASSFHLTHHAPLLYFPSLTFNKLLHSHVSCHGLFPVGHKEFGKVRAFF